MATGGTILEITYDHPTVGSGRFFAKADEDGTLDPGGLRTTDDANMVTGAGTMIKQIRPVLWSFEIVIENDQNEREDMEQMALIAASPVDATFTISHVNGSIYTGTGTIVGDIQANVGNATMPLKMQGGGNLRKISG